MDTNSISPPRRRYKAFIFIARYAALAFMIYASYRAVLELGEATRLGIRAYAYTLVEKDLALRRVEISPDGKKVKDGKDLSKQDLVSAVSVLALRLEQERTKVQTLKTILEGE